MGDSDEAPPSPSSPGEVQPRPRRRPFTPERITAAFTAMLALATLALVWTSIKQHGDSVDAIEATNRLATATENAAKDRRQATSAEFVAKADATFSQHRFDKITDDIQSHNSKYHLPKYPNQSDADVEEYISVFDDRGRCIYQ